MMPEMDGFTFLDELKAVGKHQDIPVIVITGMQITAAECNRLLGQVQKVVAKGLSVNTDIASAIDEVVRLRTPSASIS
jgi:CheY-like chemotaxis protein